MHGRRSAYVKGCRCEPCRRANTRYAKWREVSGNVQLVDSTEVRQHIERLRAAGMGSREIASRSGVARTVVERLIGWDVSRPAKRVRPVTARRILAVDAVTLADGARIDSMGTLRRLRALVAVGWTQTEIARRMGRTVANVGRLIHGRRYGNVTQETATLVARLYDDLSMTPGPSLRARRLATRYGWAPPLAWDDDTIDDPTAAPDTGTPSRKTPKGRPIAETVEDFEDTRSVHGGDVNTAAFRLGMTADALERALYRARERGIEVTWTRGAVA